MTILALDATLCSSAVLSKKPSACSSLLYSNSSFAALYCCCGQIWNTQSSYSSGVRRVTMESSSTPSADMKPPFGVLIVM